MSGRLTGTLRLSIEPPQGGVRPSPVSKPAGTPQKPPSAVRLAIAARQAGDTETFAAITAKFTKVESRQWREYRIEEALDWLREAFPHLFTEPVPLQVGIHEALFEQRPANVGSRALSRALTRWASRPAYRRQIKSGVERQGLGGGTNGGNPEADPPK